jgi:cytochrome P450
MSDPHLRDEVMTLFLAGHETTANALSWLWYELGRNPQVERRLRDEISTVLEGRPPTAADLPRLGYCQRVIEETMRVHPPAWLLIRQARGADEIGGYPIPSGRVILISPYVIHRHPDFWEDPEKFDPDRFLPERSQKRPRLAYLPFGAGQRMCIGNTFALMEMQAVVATVLQRFRLSVVRDHLVEPEPLVTLRPKHGIQMTAASA